MPHYIDGSCASGFAVSFNTNTTPMASLVGLCHVSWRAEWKSRSYRSGFRSIRRCLHSRLELGLFSIGCHFRIGTVPNSWTGMVFASTCCSCETFIAKLDGTYGQALRGQRCCAAWQEHRSRLCKPEHLCCRPPINGLRRPQALSKQSSRRREYGFVTKISPSGYNLLYSTFLGEAETISSATLP